MKLGVKVLLGIALGATIAMVAAPVVQIAAPMVRTEEAGACASPSPDPCYTATTPTK